MKEWNAHSTAAILDILAVETLLSRDDIIIL